MELRHLRYFVGVAEALSFTKAAKQLHTAQPSLSRQVKDLEEELGVRLLNRTKQLVTLTDEGRSFLADAKRLLALAAETVECVRRRKAARFVRSTSGPSAISFTICCRGLSLRSVNCFPLFRLTSLTCRAVNNFARLKMASSIWVSLDYTSQLRAADWNSEPLRPTKPSPPCQRQSAGGQNDGRAESSRAHVFHRNVRSELSLLLRMVEQDLSPRRFYPEGCAGCRS